MLRLSKINEDYWNLREKFDKHINEYDERMEVYKKMRKTCRDKRNKYYGLHQKHYKMWDKWFDAEEADDVVLADKIKREMDKLWQTILKTKREWQDLEFQIVVNDHILDIHDKMYNKALDKMKKVCNIIKKKCCVRNITKSKMIKLENEECCICLEKHKIKDIMTTSCGHIFGKSCFEKILRNRYYKDLEMVCPLCRSLAVDVTIYRRK